MTGCIKRRLALVNQLVIRLAGAYNEVAIGVVVRISIDVMNVRAFRDWFSDGGFDYQYVLQLFLSANKPTVVSAWPQRAIAFCSLLLIPAEGIAIAPKLVVVLVAKAFSYNLSATHFNCAIHFRRNTRDSYFLLYCFFRSG